MSGLPLQENSSIFGEQLIPILGRLHATRELTAVAANFCSELWIIPQYADTVWANDLNPLRLEQDMKIFNEAIGTMIS